MQHDNAPGACETIPVSEIPYTYLNYFFLYLIICQKMSMLPNTSLEHRKKCKILTAVINRHKHK